MERQEPIEELRKRSSEIRARLEDLPREIETLERISREYRNALKIQAPWWRRLTGNLADETLKSYWDRSAALSNELLKLKDESFNVGRAIDDIRTAKKRYLDAQVARNTADARKQVQAVKQEKFNTSSIENLKEEFQRKNFLIQPNDYRRGNSIDNYFRKNASTVFAAFAHRCVFCGTTHDLTFDHYALSKNEGGNFALVTADKSSIRLNIVVLCRGCNAAKAQCGHLMFFNDAQRARAVLGQRALLDALLADRLFLKLVDKWSR